MSNGERPTDSRPHATISELDAAELLDRASGSDESAWRELVARYQRLVFATVRGFRLQPEDADDVFQETFARLHRHAGRLRNPRGLARWIVQTTHRLCLDHLNRRRSRGETVMPDDLVDPGVDLEALIERLERAQRIRDTLATLSPRCRSLLEQLYFQPEPLSYQEIARRLEMPIGSIGPTRARCFEALLLRLRGEADLERAGGAR